MSTLDDFFGDDNQDEIEKCDECGTTENLTVHLVMNEQTGKYAFHYCVNCDAKHEAEREAELEKSNETTNRNIFIAETDN